MVCNVHRVLYAERLGQENQTSSYFYLARLSPPIKLEDDQQLKSWKRISFYWEEEPADDVLSVILPRPAGSSECQWLMLSTFAILTDSS